ncbi:lytic transglycosylase domain-containing protein [Patescibacteria group bacterium]|nr:lytic transglycosylase domain-containing protein [Patescibacteria group bacterium]
MFGGEKILLSQSKLIRVDWPTHLEFCGEEVPLEDFYIREAWEKEFLVTLAQDYQNILYLKRSPKYFPLIESELEKRGLPDDLKFIAVAESALREDARSSAGAEGIWQFIPETAQRYGLRVDGEIDERKNFEKATPAALDYLEFLHEKFDSWTLAAAAYNAGENGIERRLDEQMVGDYYDLYLNEETSRYLFRILVIKEIMNSPKKYGYEITKNGFFAWPNLELKTVVGPIGDLAAFARENSTTLRALKELNPWIVGDGIPSGSFRVKIPR